MHNNIFKMLLTVLVAMVAITGLITETTYAQSYDVDESGNVVFYSPDGSQSVSKDNLIKPNHGVVLFGYQNTYTDVIDASVLPRALGNNRAIANSETRIGRYYSTLSQGEIYNTGFDVGQVHQGQVTSGNESWAYSHLTKINQLRYEHGLAPVSLNVDASGYAFSKSQDMIQNGYFAHQNTNGDNIITQYLSFNPDDVNVHAVGENMAQAYPSTATSIEAQAFDDLLHSPGHYQNMIDPAWDSVGLGFYYDPSVNSKVYFVQLFYTTDYSAKNGLSAEGLANSYWNYEFYQKDVNPEAFETIVAEAPIEEEVVEEEVVQEEVVEEEVVEEEVVEETTVNEDLALQYEENEQLVETLRTEVEEKRQAQSEASESLAANQAEIERVELENAEIVDPYRASETLIEEKTIELEATTDPALREQLEAEIAEATAVIQELQPQMDEVNVLLNPLTEQQIELENAVAERAEEKRIAEEALVEQSDKLATMTPPETGDTTAENETEEVVDEGVEEVVDEGVEEVVDEGVEEVVDESVEEVVDEGVEEDVDESVDEVVDESVEEVTEEEDETLTESVEEVVEEEVTEEATEEVVEDVEVTFESDEEPTTSEYNVNLSNNIVEVPQNNTPPEVATQEDRQAEEVDEEAVEEVEEESAEEASEESEEEVNEEATEEDVAMNEEVEEEEVQTRNLSDLVGRSDSDDSSNDEVSGVLPNTGLAENPWLIVGAIGLLLVGAALIFFTVIRRK